ncbi:MAG: energy transducer TonB [Gemmatimonadaceae bacterium]|nr:energy transducer TonB [Gemmatimonadaceae bacterium]MCW5826433.1 energy transducer TonB [Gemmatimonadaceae bacterium]
MLTNLIASRPARHHNANSTALSFALHVGVIAAMVVASAPSEVFAPADGNSRIVPLTAPVTPRPAAPQPQRTAPPRANTSPATAPAVPAVDVPPVTAPTEIPTGIAVDVAPAVDLPAGDGGLGAPDLGAGESVGSGDGVPGAESVDVPARLLQSSPLPRYPEFLRQSRVEGGVRVRFVVNADGRANLASLVILESTHPAFSESVRAILPRLRFTPARVGRARVRQVVEIPFGFELQR